MYGGISFINQIDIQSGIGNNSSKTVLNTLQFVNFVDKKQKDAKTRISSHKSGISCKIPEQHFCV